MPAVQALSCPQCGASIKNKPNGESAGQRSPRLSTCEYCGSALSIRADRLPNLAGSELPGKPRRHRHSDRSVKYHWGLLNCPRCHHKLLPTQLSGGTLQSCKHCSGLWLPNSVIDALKHGSRSTYKKLKRLNSGRSKGRHRPRIDLHQKVECPDCGDSMDRKIYRMSQPVVIDFCSDHGIWFDRNELLGTYLRGARSRRRSGKSHRNHWSNWNFKYRRGWRSHALFVVIWMIVELIDEIFD